MRFLLAMKMRYFFVSSFKYDKLNNGEIDNPWTGHSAAPIWGYPTKIRLNVSTFYFILLVYVINFELL